MLTHARPARHYESLARRPRREAIRGASLALGVVCPASTLFGVGRPLRGAVSFAPCQKWERAREGEGVLRWSASAPNMRLQRTASPRCR